MYLHRSAGPPQTLTTSQHFLSKNVLIRNTSELSGSVSTEETSVSRGQIAMHLNFVIPTQDLKIPCF